MKYFKFILKVNKKHKRFSFLISKESYLWMKQMIFKACKFVKCVHNLQNFRFRLSGINTNLYLSIDHFHYISYKEGT